MHIYISGNGNIIACSCSCTNQFGCQPGDRHQASGQFPRYHFPNFVVRRRYWRFTRRDHQFNVVSNTSATKSPFHIDVGTIHCWCIVISYCSHLFGTTITSTEHIAFGLKLFGHIGCWSGEKESTKRTQTILDRCFLIRNTIDTSNEKRMMKTIEYNNTSTRQKQTNKQTKWEKQKPLHKQTSNTDQIKWLLGLISMVKLRNSFSVEWNTKHSIII